MYYQLPQASAEPPMSVTALMNATLRLSDILQEEAGLITEMRYGEIGALHAEKLALTKLLETYQAHMAKNPNFVRGASAEEREELLLVTDDLAVSVNENFRKVSAAKAVNARIMQAMKDVLTEQHHPGTYSKHGYASGPQDLTISLNLNQKA